MAFCPAGRWGGTERNCKIRDFGRYSYSCTAIGVNLWETNPLFCLAGNFVWFMLWGFDAAVSGSFIPDTRTADGTFRRFGCWGIGRFGKSGDFALDDGCIDKSCGFCNRGNNALFHRGNDSKNVSIPVALRIEKITGRYFIHRQKLAER